MSRLSFNIILFLTLLPALSFAQYNWKLEKSNNTIKVYTSDIAHSSFKAVKVECTFNGTYTKLISILSNVNAFHEWIYNNKSVKLLKQNSPLDFIYYSETHMPFPLSNRDLVIHMKIRTDSLPKFLYISGNLVTDMVPEIPMRVRVPRYVANWKVTMPSASTVQINYILEIDPGGTLPAWAANIFAEKGPFATFTKLEERMRK